MHTKSRTKKQANMLGGAGRATFMLDGRYILAKAASLAIATDLMSESIPVHRTHARKALRVATRHVGCSRRAQNRRAREAAPRPAEGIG